MYKEIAAKGLIRMNEEFQMLIDIWKAPPKGLGGGAKKQILILLTQILIEVPRWKVPAAEPLIKDPVYLSNAIKQVPKFFNEVLSYEVPQKSGELAKAFKSRTAAPVKAKQKKDEVLNQNDAYERAIMAYINK